MDQLASKAVPAQPGADDAGIADARMPARDSAGRASTRGWNLESIQLGMVRAVLATLTRLGPVAASNLVGTLFRVIGPLLPVTRVAGRNLRMAMPELGAQTRGRVLRDMWENLGRTAGEFPHLADLPWNSKAGSGWEVANDHVLVEQARRRGPVIFISGHISNWEMLPPIVGSYGMPFSSIYRPLSNRAIDGIILGLRRRAMRQDVPMFAKGARGAREAVAHLRRGGHLGMLVDQKMNDGIEARLFGLPAMTAPAAATLALRFGCAVIPGHIQRIGPARLRLVVEEPLPLLDSGNRQTDILHLTQMMNDCLERWIRQQPQAWLWLHRRFPKHRPAPAGRTTWVMPTRQA